LIDSASGRAISDTIKSSDFQTLDKSYDHPLSFFMQAVDPGRNSSSDINRLEM